MNKYLKQVQKNLTQFWVFEIISYRVPIEPFYVCDNFSSKDVAKPCDWRIVCWVKKQQNCPRVCQDCRI